MWEYYLKKVGFHFLICTVLLGLLILSPTIVSAIPLWLGIYVFLLALLFPSRLNTLHMLVLSVASTYLSSLILPAIHPWILTSLVPSLTTPLGFILITLTLVSVVTELTLGQTFNPLRLIFSSKTREALARDYERRQPNSEPQHHSTSSVTQAPVNTNPFTNISQQPTRHPATNFNTNPRTLKDITLNDNEQKNLLTRQTSALQKLNKLVTAQEEGKYAFNDTQMELYRKLLDIQQDEPICPITLEKYGESPGTYYGFLYKETYETQTNAWRVEPKTTHFFSQGLKNYFKNQHEQRRIIQHPILQNEPLVKETPPTRYRFHKTKKLSEYNSVYKSQAYKYYLNTDVIYYAEQIIALRSELNQTTQYRR